MSTVNILVAIFIFIAAIIAGVVQMNLTNMYVSQKMRELSIMSVNAIALKKLKKFKPTDVA